MIEYNAFETQRLIIKPTSLEDAPFIYELVNTPKWLKFIGDRDIKSLDDAKEYIINSMLPQLAKLGFSNYTVIRKSDKAKIGTCGLYDREGLEGIDIGFAFLPQYEKNGYAFESCTKLKEIGLNEFGITTLNAITTPDNTSSQRLLEKLGLQFDKIVKIANDKEELFLYTLNSH